jgi:hypothetical protein
VTWEIAVSVSGKADATPSKRTVGVESGRCVDVLAGAAECRGIPTCTAVACSHPERLALVLASAAGARVDGRPVPCPLVAMDTRGGKLSLRTSSRNVELEVTYEAKAALTSSGREMCSLCHDPLGNGAAARCCHCGRRYHSDCSPLIQGRCAPCARSTKLGR